MILKTIPICQELLDIITPYSDWFFEQEDRHDMREKPNREFDFDLRKATEEDYLQHIMNKGRDHEGFPETALCCDLSQGMNFVPSRHIEMQQKTNKEVISFLGARNTAVWVYYPSSGFMGWHTNWNAPGYNILLSYNTQDRGGFFRYRDPVTRERITLYDEVAGWNAKVGYFGSGRERDDIIYHCAGATTGERLTFAFIIPDKDMWKSMIEDISGEEFNDL